MSMFFFNHKINTIAKATWAAYIKSIALGLIAFCISTSCYLQDIELIVFNADDFQQYILTFFPLHILQIKNILHWCS